mgnify:CR=1 FL=1
MTSIVTEVLIVEQACREGDEDEEIEEPMLRVKQVKQDIQEDLPSSYKSKTICSLCKKEGHIFRHCPQGRWCRDCKWTHLKSEPCDKGAAKNAWIKNKMMRYQNRSNNNGNKRNNSNKG